MSFCPAEMGPPHHHPGHRMPHPGINEHPPWAGPQHPDFGPPPHGFNGQPPHMRRQGPPHINHDDPSLVPNVPYFDLPAGLMAPLVKVNLDTAPFPAWAEPGESGLCQNTRALRPPPLLSRPSPDPRSWKTTSTSLWTLKTTASRRPCRPARGCWRPWKPFTAHPPTTGPETGRALTRRGRGWGLLSPLPESMSFERNSQTARSSVPVRTHGGPFWSSRGGDGTQALLRAASGEQCVPSP
jgi:hypothetical protein